MRVIVLTCWNRPEYLRQTLESWEKAIGVEKYEIMVRVDPGNPAVNDVLRSFDARLPLTVTGNQS